MYFLGLTRAEDGALSISLSMEQREYTDVELARALQQSILQIAPLIRGQMIYIDQTLSEKHAMRLGWILRGAYGCAVYVWNSNTEKYVQLI